MVKVEADDANAPGFLWESVLGVSMAEEVVLTMQEVSACLVLAAAQRASVDIVKGDCGEELRKGQEGEEGQEKEEEQGGKERGVE